MFNIISLFLTKFRTLVTMKAPFRTLILSFFLYGQIGALAHAHDHEHSEEEQETACVVCILAVNEDETAELERDVPDASDGPDILQSTPSLNTIQIEGRIICLYVGFYKSPQLNPSDRCLDEVRAPPPNLILS